MKNNSSASVQTSKLTSKWRDTFNQHCMSLRRQDETLQHALLNVSKSINYIYIKRYRTSQINK